MSSFSKNYRFDKVRRFVNDNPSLTIVKDDLSLTIVNDDPSLTIVNIIVNKIFFQKRSQIVLIKTIAIRFLKVQNEWVVFKNDSF